MKVVDLIRRVRTLLQDNNSSSYRWTDQTLLDCFNEAQLAVVQNRPDAHSEVTPFSCVNSARQSVPADAYRLLDVIDNSVSGRATLKTTRDALNDQVVNWSTTAGSDVEMFIYDEKSPDYFYVYPVVPVDHVLNILIAKTPDVVAITDFSSDTQTLELDFIWLNPLINYMLFRAYITDGDTQRNIEQAQSYLKMFANDLQLKWNVDLIFSQPWPASTS